MVDDRYTPEQLDQMHQQLWQCVLQFANLSATQERNRIARDLHDSLGYALTALNFQLQSAIKLCKPDPNQAQEFLTEAHRLVTIATQEVRQSVHALRTDESETRSLASSIDGLIQDFQQTTGINPDVEIEMGELPAHISTTLYRIVQESLNNIRKYAQATEVAIQIITTGTMIQLTVQDNGRGFDPECVAGGYGLQGMQERIAVLQGQLWIESSPGQGCQIQAEIPIYGSIASSDQSAISVASEIVPVRPVVEIGAWQPLDLNEWRYD